MVFRKNSKGSLLPCSLLSPHSALHTIVGVFKVLRSLFLMNQESKTPLQDHISSSKAAAPTLQTAPPPGGQVGKSLSQRRGPVTTDLCLEYNLGKREVVADVRRWAETYPPVHPTLNFILRYTGHVCLGFTLT